MRITIDNLDGLGAVDYTLWVTAEGPITLRRRLNQPTLCTATLALGRSAPLLPVRRARILASSDSGSLLFTGYLATEPVREYLGQFSSGAAYVARLSAISDEWLLDNLGTGAGQRDAALVNTTSGGLLARMMQRAAGSTTLPLQTAGSGTQLVGSFTPRASAPWSSNAAAAAGAAYSAYRALNGTLTTQPAAAVTHTLSDADGTLSVAALALGSVRELANDITLSGAEEPAAYIAETFLGDGTTTAFTLQHAAYRDTHRTLLLDSFPGAAVDPTLWTLADPRSHITLTSAGLTLSGGTGQDGQTTLTALDAVEMGGSLLAELGSVQLAAASDGMLAGFYQGTPQLANCFAGLRVRQQVSASSSTTVLVAVLNGAEVGSVFTPLAGHNYTLRMRLHCVEMQRLPQRYYTLADGVIQSFGQLSGIAAPMDAVFELVDQGAASNTPATVLYDTAATAAPLASTPAACSFVPVNSTQLFGSVGSVALTRPGSLWVVSTPPSAAAQTRLMGTAGQGVDCQVSYGTQAGSPGKVTFFSGRVPIAGERITVSYRSVQRSVARLQSAASVAAEAAGGGTGTCRWLGKVLQPAARSSADCESAAQAILALATSRTATVAGSYTQLNPAQDIWPGDLLAITSEGVVSTLLVRSVELQDQHAQPELLQYKLALANDWATQWADGLGLQLSEEIAADALLPQTAADAPAQVLANLQQLAVTSLTTTALQVDAGTAPPAGGGFEVRRRDDQFGPTTDPGGLVLRSPVRSFSLPRAAQLEEFYIRMYDASSPPLYSRFSSALLVNAPVA